MGCDSYNVQVDGIIVAEGMPIEHALIFVKALFLEWNNEKSLSITIERENFDEKANSNSARDDRFNRVWDQ